MVIWRYEPKCEEMYGGVKKGTEMRVEGLKCEERDRGAGKGMMCKEEIEL
jgi:hypothetical protein